MASWSEASGDVLLSSRETDPTPASVFSALDQDTAESEEIEMETEPGVKRMKVAEQLTVAQEEDLDDWSRYRDVVIAINLF